jgi:acyl carrier protein
MVPGVYVQLAEMPLSPNRKIDRKALPAPEAVERETEFVAPRSPIEEALSEIWTEVLGVERVGVFDNFFELGGHSLLATQVISRAKKKFESELPLRSIFEEPTVAGLASVIMRSQEQQKVEAITKLSRGASAEKLNLLANLNRLSEADVDALLGDLLAKERTAYDG